MTRRLDLGFIALTDSAPLIVAQERGFFEAEGLRVALRREVSWATLRDKVAAGLYEGAHMLAPALLAANLGAGSDAARLVAPLALNVHGAAIGVSSELAREMAARAPYAPRSASALAGAAAARRARGQPAIRMAVVFPFSMHNYMLRAWAANAGLDPDRDLHIGVAPPTIIGARLNASEIDGFCVGAPWGAACEAESDALIVLEAGEFWPDGPDKVLALSAAWAAAEPDAVLALTRALLAAARWADAPENAEALIDLLARPDLVGGSAPLIAKALNASEATRIRFARNNAAFPWRSHARWIVTQMLRWGQIDPTGDFARAAEVFRPDIYRAAAASLAMAYPSEDLGDQGPVGEPNPPSIAFDAESLRRDAGNYPITRLKG